MVKLRLPYRIAIAGLFLGASGCFDTALDVKGGLKFTSDIATQDVQYVAGAFASVEVSLFDGDGKPMVDISSGNVSLRAFRDSQCQSPMGQNDNPPTVTLSHGVAAFTAGTANMQVTNAGTFYIQAYGDLFVAVCSPHAVIVNAGAADHLASLNFLRTYQIDMAKAGATSLMLPFQVEDLYNNPVPKPLTGIPSPTTVAGNPITLTSPPSSTDASGIGSFGFTAPTTVGLTVVKIPASAAIAHDSYLEIWTAPSDLHHFSVEYPSDVLQNQNLFARVSAQDSFNNIVSGLAPTQISLSASFASTTPTRFNLVNGEVVSPLPPLFTTSAATVTVNGPPTLPTQPPLAVNVTSKACSSGGINQRVASVDTTWALPTNWLLNTPPSGGQFAQLGIASASTILSTSASIGCFELSAGAFSTTTPSPLTITGALFRVAGGSLSMPPSSILAMDSSLAGSGAQQIEVNVYAPLPSIQVTGSKPLMITANSDTYVNGPVTFGPQPFYIQGNVHFAQPLTVPAGSTLEVLENASLFADAGLTISGTVIVHPAGKILIMPGQTFALNGTLQLRGVPGMPALLDAADPLRSSSYSLSIGSTAVLKARQFVIGGLPANGLTLTANSSISNGLFRYTPGMATALHLGGSQPASSAFLDHIIFEADPGNLGYQALDANLPIGSVFGFYQVAVVPYGYSGGPVSYQDLKSSKWMTPDPFSVSNLIWDH